MLLDVKIKNFGGTLPQVSEDAVAAFKRHGKDRLADLTRYLKGKENLLDAATIEEHLFKVEDADVFLSHAHRDHDQVVRLAVALQDLGLKVFVDSCVWGDAYRLLNAVDEMYSVDTSKTNTYFYGKVTRTAANVYMILNVALQRMIDRCELFLFLKPTLRRSPCRITQTRQSTSAHRGCSRSWPLPARWPDGRGRSHWSTLRKLWGEPRMRR